MQIRVMQVNLIPLVLAYLTEDRVRGALGILFQREIAARRLARPTSVGVGSGITVFASLLGIFIPAGIGSLINLFLKSRPSREETRGRRSENRRSSS